MTKLARRPISLAVRVMVFVAVAIGLSMLLTGHLVQRSIPHHFTLQDAEELQVVADSARSVLQEAGGDRVAQLAALPGAVSGHHGVYYQVATVAGELLYSSPGMDWSSLPADLPVVESVEPDNLGNLARWRAQLRGRRSGVRGGGGALPDGGGCRHPVPPAISIDAATQAVADHAAGGCADSAGRGIRGLPGPRPAAHAQ